MNSFSVNSVGFCLAPMPCKHSGAAVRILIGGSKLDNHKSFKERWESPGMHCILTIAVPTDALCLHVRLLQTENKATSVKK